MGRRLVVGRKIRGIWLGDKFMYGDNLQSENWCECIGPDRIYNGLEKVLWLR